MLDVKRLVWSDNNVEVLKGVTFSLGDKESIGILVPQKKQGEALARIICGCIDADEGEVRLGDDIMSRRAIALKKKIRLIPSELVLDPLSTPVEYLDFVARMLDVDEEKRYRQIKEALELLNLDSIQNKIFLNLSAEERCRLSIAAALIGNPEAIVLENAFWGIDQGSVDSMLDVIELILKIKTVVFISQKPAEVKRVCSRVAMLSDGKIVIDDNIEQIEKKINATAELHIKARGDGAQIIDAIRSLECVVSAAIDFTEANGVHSIRIEHYPKETIKDDLFEQLSKINVPMLAVQAFTLTLDDVYFSIASKERDEVVEDSKRIGFFKRLTSRKEEK